MRLRSEGLAFGVSMLALVPWWLSCDSGGDASSGAGGAGAGGTGGAGAGGAVEVSSTTSTTQGGGGAVVACGDGRCAPDEDCTLCREDCGPCAPVCGDGVCDATEDCDACSVDCGECIPEEVLVAGGSCADLQTGLDEAAAAPLPLRLTGAFTVNCTIRIPSDVQIDATAATLNMTKTGRFRNNTNGSAGGYTHAGGFVWNGGTFVGAGDTIFTISHAPSFTISNTIQYAYAETGDLGHGIEINSSGGDHTPNVYTVHIVGNTFRGVTGQRTNSNDEAVQVDFAWSGSGADAPFDATMTHNVRIADNTFDRLDASGTWEFSLCAIGGHRGSAGEPAQRHNGLLIENNTIYGAVGATANVSPNKGAIALWNVRDVWVLNNTFIDCTASRLVSAWDANASRALNGDAVNINISGNTHNGAPVTITMPATNTTGG